MLNPPISPIQRAFYELYFERDYLKAKASTFQEFFEKLMGLAYRADFMPCRPWGNDGDKKNDGFLRSEYCLFQVYAPNEMTKTKAISKIREDFLGAVEHWDTHFTKWVFVHNSSDGLPPHVQEAILELERDYPEIKLEHWGYNELLDIFRKLQLPDLEGWYGTVPTEETKQQLGFHDLKGILEALSRKIEYEVPSTDPISPVSSRKIEANLLSPAVLSVLTQGMAKAPLVGLFLDQWHDAELGERIAQSFRVKYPALKASGLSPNQVFQQITDWVGGVERGQPSYVLAVYTVMAYYFESCDFFEDPRDISCDIAQ